MLRVSKIDSACRKTVFPRFGATKEVTQGVIEISYVDIWHWGSLRAAVRPTVTLRDGVSRSARAFAVRFGPLFMGGLRMICHARGSVAMVV